MKKLIVTAIAAATCFAAFGQRTPAEIVNQFNQMTNATMRDEFRKNITFAESVEICDYVYGIALTNRAEALKIFKYNGTHKLTQNASVAAEYDAKLASVGIEYHIKFYKYFPLLGENWLTNHASVVSNMPATVAAIRNHKAFYNNSWSLPELANAYAEIMAFYSTNSFSCSHFNATKIKNLILKQAPFVVKRGLRARGQSFVTKKGEPNPVQPPLDALTAALNAPRMAGIDAWIAEWCPEYEWKSPVWASNEFIDALKNDIYYGKKNLTDFNRKILLGCLGVDAYNEFIANYNGENPPSK